MALTLRVVGGLSTDEIARALLVPYATIARCVSRAKQRIKAAGGDLTHPGEVERTERMAAVLHVLYLIFNEGYTTNYGSISHRVELTAEAIRLARRLHRLRPEDGEVAGLLALMLLTDARRPASTGADGALVPLAEQDRGRWDAGAIAEGVALLTGAPGPYQVQAAIAAAHNAAPRAEDTDWPRILGLYDLLQALSPGPMVGLGRAVAVAMVEGPQAGLRALDEAEADPAIAGHHRAHAVRAHLLDLAGDGPAARVQYELAARRTSSVPEQRYLGARAASLAPPDLF